MTKTDKKRFHSIQRSLQHSETNKKLYKCWKGNNFLNLVVPQTIHRFTVDQKLNMSQKGEVIMEKAIIILGKNEYNHESSKQ